MKNTHGVILSKWIVDGKVYWPVGISALRAIELDKDPEESWKRFPHVDNKLQTDEEDICYQYMSYPTSESYDQSTQCEKGWMMTLARCHWSFLHQEEKGKRALHLTILNQVRKNHQGGHYLHQSQEKLVKWTKVLEGLHAVQNY